jgi:DNA-binding XRE family transcriptional regulator
MKKWTAAEIRELRWRLGWSQAELARRLGCRQQTVSEWETNAYEPQNAYSKLLDLLFENVETNSIAMVRQPMAEVVMKQVGYTQVNGDQIAEKYALEFDLQID